jgi:hypothetical protein
VKPGREKAGDLTAKYTKYAKEEGERNLLFGGFAFVRVFRVFRG